MKLKNENYGMCSVANFIYDYVNFYPNHYRQGVERIIDFMRYRILFFLSCVENEEKFGDVVSESFLLHDILINPLFVLIRGDVGLFYFCVRSRRMK